jgi:4-amino-4-deoxy-L-arabinose transferase-like glycosyltransferase
MRGGRWFAKYPPLFPLVLAAGVSVGLPWLVNPLLGALTGLAVYLLGREIAGWRAGLLAWVLLLVSPFFLIMGGSLMSHVLTACLVTLFLFCLCRGLTRESRGWLAAAGMAVGAAFLARPYTAALAGAAGALFALVQAPRLLDRRFAARCLVGALAGVPFVALYFVWNAVLDPSSGAGTSLYASYSVNDSLGFGADRGRGWLLTWGSAGHTPAKALRSVGVYLDYTSRHLLGWPGRTSFALVLVGAISAARGRDRRWLLLGPALALVAGHALYWATQHLGYGARYWFEALPALLVLAAVGLAALLERGLDRARGIPVGTLAAAAAIGGLTMWSFGNYLPPRLAELERYGGVGPELKREIERTDLGRAIVFVPTEGLLFNDGFFMNDPFLRGAVLFARDLGEENARLIAAHPDRSPWRWDGRRLAPLHATRTAGARGPA